MNLAQGRYVFEEAQIADRKRMNAEKRVLQEARSANLTALLVATPLFGHDQRPRLSSQDLVLGRSRCSVYSCQGILEKFEVACCYCECVRIAMCACEGCGQPYNNKLLSGGVR